jgi:ABC-type nitrate/sulfonate/bicarbonate transport system permease component
MLSIPRIARLILLLALCSLWQLYALLGAPEYVLGPVEVFRHFAVFLFSGEILPHVSASLGRSLPGFLLGAALGIALGLLAGVARWLDDILSLPIFLTYPVPKIVIFPIVMVWFGIGDLSKILIIALACFYPAFINAYYGARSTATTLVWSAQNMGARRRQVFRKVVIPSALPMIFGGVRVSLALSFVLLFATEMINARSGLGFLIRQSENSLRFDLMYDSILAMAILGYLGDYLLRAARRRAVGWQELQSA